MKSLKSVIPLLPSSQTPVIVRFSTVVHERGSPETLRDPRGFAVKFYTREGNFDMVGNNMPVRRHGEEEGRTEGLLGAHKAAYGGPLLVGSGRPTFRRGPRYVSTSPHYWLFLFQCLPGVLHPRRHEVPGHGSRLQAQPQEPHPGGLAHYGLPVAPPRVMPHGA